MLTLQIPSTPTPPRSDLEGADIPPTLVFDRRIGPRRPAEGALLAAVAPDRQSEAGGVRLVRLELLDAGSAGVGAVSPSRLRPGSCVSLHPVGVPLARDCGVVARCDERPEGGYLVGIAFDTRRAA